MLVGLVTTAVGCSNPPEGGERIVVVVTAAPELASETTSLRVSSDNGETARLAVSANTVWPLVFTLVPAAGHTGGTVSVAAFDGERALARRIAKVHFKSHAKAYWAVHLSLACRAQLAACEAADLTCGDCEGGCKPIADAELQTRDPRGTDFQLCSEQPVESGRDASAPDGSHDHEDGDAALPDLDGDATLPPPFVDGGPANVGDGGDGDGGDGDGGDGDGGDGDGDAGDGDGGPPPPPPPPCLDPLPDAMAAGRPMVVLDFDGDEKLDLAIGYPDDAGSVAIFRGAHWDGQKYGGNPLRWHQSSDSIHGAVETGDHCGAALATGDFNGDGRADLAVGCPDESLEFSGGQVLSQAGVALVLFGSDYALDHYVVDGPGQYMDQDDFGPTRRAESGDRLGASLTAIDINADGVDDLAIGVPDEAVTSALGAIVVHGGVVNVVLGKRDSGLDFATVVGLSEETKVGATFGLVAGRDDTYESNDRFAATLTSTKLLYDGLLRPALLIGAPGENEGEGALHVVVPDPEAGMKVPLVHAALHGDGTAGGRFGHAVAPAGDAQLFVSAPDAEGGKVAHFDLSAGWDAPVVRWLIQPEGAQTGGPESQDAFGWSLGLLGDRLFVGVPGEESVLTECNSGAVDSFRALDFSDHRHLVDSTLSAYGYALAPLDDRIAVSAPPAREPSFQAP